MQSKNKKYNPMLQMHIETVKLYVLMEYLNFEYESLLKYSL